MKCTMVADDTFPLNDDGLEHYIIIPPVLSK